jgi:diguanylate cyclase (GGDEF)-like protein
VGLGSLATVGVAVLIPAPLGTAFAVGIALSVAVGAAAHAGRRTRRGGALAAVLALALGLLLAGAAEPVAQWAPCAGAIVLAAEIVGIRVDRLRLISITDPLTGLLDRQGLWEAARKAIATCRRTGRPLTLAQLDLDEFKAVNDSFGHAAGDRLLRECGDSWTAELGGEQVLARVGGDEFLLLLPGSDLDAAERLLERLRFRSPAPWSHGTAQLRADDDLDACLLRADAALYAAKARRRVRRTRALELHHASSGAPIP